MSQTLTPGRQDGWRRQKKQNRPFAQREVADVLSAETWNRLPHLREVLLLGAVELVDSLGGEGSELLRGRLAALMTAVRHGWPEEMLEAWRQQAEQASVPWLEGQAELVLHRPRRTRP